MGLQNPATNHYATLGLDRCCTTVQIRAAYRALAREHHPDLNPGSPAALIYTQELNAAYEILGDPERRKAYDHELDAPKKPVSRTRAMKVSQNISQDVNLPLEDFLRGTKREVRVKDPANPNGLEIYELVVPPHTAPGTRLCLPRGEPFAGGFVQIRLKALPNFRFKVRGSNLRCDLKIKPPRATQGGTEMIRGIAGALLPVKIPRRVGRNEVIKISGEGLPRLRGGRGDLLVRIIYRPEVRIARP